MSSTVKTTMLNAISAYFTKVKANIRPVVYEKVTINTGATKTYNLVDLIPTLSAYDPLSARITVLVLDTEAGSPTLNSYINSEAVITAGVNPAGLVTILNTDTNNRQILVRVDHPSFKV